MLNTGSKTSLLGKVSHAGSSRHFKEEICLFLTLIESYACMCTHTPKLKGKNDDKEQDLNSLILRPTRIDSCGRLHTTLSASLQSKHG